MAVDILNDNKGIFEFQKLPISARKNNRVNTSMSQNGANILFNKQKMLFKVKNQLVREFLAELLGTFLLVAFIDGTCAQNMFLSKDNPYMNSILSVDICCGLGVTIAILVVGKVSGAHINPAVSFTNLLIGEMTFVRFLIYVLAQLVGAFLAALVVFINYYESIVAADPEFTLKTASIFATYPNEKLSVSKCFFDQILGTALLIITVLAVSDKKNEQLSHGSVAALLGMTVVAIGTGFGYNCGFALNPARDLGPRMLTLVAGWGTQVFTGGDYFFWVPIAGPMVGAVFGIVIYFLFIGNHWPNEVDDKSMPIDC